MSAETAALRAEFRSTGQSHYRVGNPSRYFFEPLEPVLVDGAPERANSGQIARGSLGPIWSLVTEKLLPSMADGYVASAKKVIVANNQAEARRLAVKHVALLRRLPLGFVPLLLRELIVYDWKFPAVSTVV